MAKKVADTKSIKGYDRSGIKGGASPKSRVAMGGPLTAHNKAQIKKSTGGTTVAKAKAKGKVVDKGKAIPGWDYAVAGPSTTAKKSPRKAPAKGGKMNAHDKAAAISNEYARKQRQKKKKKK